MNWPRCETFDYSKFENIISEIDSYLCEIKESQIRTGLHVFGKITSESKLWLVDM